MSRELPKLPVVPRGVVFNIFGTSLDQEIMRELDMSIHLVHKKGFPVAVLVEGDLIKQCTSVDADFLIKYPFTPPTPGLNAFARRRWNYLLSPFEASLYLDTDCFWVGGMDFLLHPNWPQPQHVKYNPAWIFEAIEKHGLVMAEDGVIAGQTENCGPGGTPSEQAVRYGNMCERHGVHRSTLLYNGGLLGWKKNDPNVLKLLDWSWPLLSTEDADDQEAYSIAFELGIAKVFTVSPHQWNARCGGCHEHWIAHPRVQIIHNPTWLKHLLKPENWQMYRKVME